MTRTRSDLLAVIRGGHQEEIALFLGWPLSRFRETFRLHLSVLDDLGYALVRKSEVPAAAPTPTPEPVVREPEPVDHRLLYHAIEGAIIEVTERRMQALRGNGAAVSDQAEVRAIVAAVEELLNDRR